MLPRCYRFDGSTGMDLRPAAVLEADAARIDELRRRRDSMAVTTRIRMVDQPPEGLLPLSLFGRTPLPDRAALHPRTMETVAPDIAGLYVDYMTRGEWLSSESPVHASTAHLLADGIAFRPP